MILKLLDKNARYYDESNRHYWFRRGILQSVPGFILLALALVNSVISMIYVIGQLSVDYLYYCSLSTYTHQYLLIYESYQFLCMLPILLTGIGMIIMKAAALLAMCCCPGVLSSCTCP